MVKSEAVELEHARVSVREAQEMGRVRALPVVKLRMATDKAAALMPETQRDLFRAEVSRRMYEFGRKYPRIFWGTSIGYLIGAVIDGLLALWLITRGRAALVGTAIGFGIAARSRVELDQVDEELEVLPALALLTTYFAPEPDLASGDAETTGRHNADRRHEQTAASRR